MTAAIKRRFLSITLTNRCQLRCRYCLKGERNGAAAAKIELSLSQWARFLRSLTAHYKDAFEIDISGGEPLLRPDLEELIALCRELGHQITLCSNGLLVTAERAQRLGRAGLTAIGFSLDSLREVVHDELRGKKGTASALLKAIETMQRKAPNVIIGLHTVISAKNASELMDLLHFAQGNPAIAYLYLQALSAPLEAPPDPLWFDDPQYADLWPDPAMVSRSLRLLRAAIDHGNLAKLGNPVAQLELFERYFRDPLHFADRLSCTFDPFSLLAHPNGDLQCYHGHGGIIGNAAQPALEQLFDSLTPEKMRTGPEHGPGFGHVVLNCFPRRETLQIDEIQTAVATLRQLIRDERFRTTN